MRVGGDGHEGVGLKLGHVLIGSGEEEAGDGNSAGEMAELIENDDRVQLLEVEFLFAEPFEHFLAGNGLADEGELGVHHAACGRRIKGEQFADVVGFLIRHFFEEFLGGFFGEIGEEVGSGIGSHFLDDVGGFFRIELFDDLRGQAFIELGEDGRRGLFVEGGDDALTLGRGEFFHHFGQIGGVEILEFFVGDAELYAAEGVGLNEIDKFPADGALRKLALQLAHKAGRSNTLKETTDGAGNANIDLGDAKFDVFVGGKFGKIDVVDADDFAAGGVDNLLVE